MSKGAYMFSLLLKFTRRTKSTFSLLSFVLLLFPSFSLADIEPNNTCNTAELISVNTTVNGSLRRDNPNRDRDDYYYFVAPSNGTVRITTSGFTGVMDGYLYNSACSSELTIDTASDSNINISYNVKPPIDSDTITFLLLC